MPATVQRRAPRLGPRERLAPHITRTGRFRKVDPLEPRKLPRLGRVLGVLGWAVLVEESLRRAYRSVRADKEPAEGGAGEHG